MPTPPAPGPRPSGGLGQDLCRSLHLDAHPAPEDNPDPLEKEDSMTKRMACIVLLFCAASISAPAQLTTLASFDKADGRDPGFPRTPFAQGTNGNFYGTTVDRSNNARRCG